MFYNEIEFWWTEDVVFAYKNGVLWQHGGKPWVRACGCCATSEQLREWKSREIQIGGTINEAKLGGYPTEKEWGAIEEIAENERRLP